MQVQAVEVRIACYGEAWLGSLVQFMAGYGMARRVLAVASRSGQSC